MRFMCTFCMCVCIDVYVCICADMYICIYMHRCELVADLDHAFGPGVKLMRGYAVRSGEGINESL